MRITKAEIAAISVTLVLLIAVGAFYLGRTTAEPVIYAEEPTIAPEAPGAASLTEDAGASEEAASAAESVAEETAVVNINRADLAELQTLPNIGPVLAQRILDYRGEHGEFYTVEELKNVDGIGDKIFASIENLVEVGD